MPYLRSSAHSSLAILFLGCILVSLPTASATILTLHGCLSFSDGRADRNPAWRDVPYSSLELSCITGYGFVTHSSHGSCIRVCGSVGSMNLLVVDQYTLAADHFVISAGAGLEIAGSDTGNHMVTVTEVDPSGCADIWDGRMFWDHQNPPADSCLYQRTCSCSPCSRK